MTLETQTLSSNETESIDASAGEDQGRYQKQWYRNEPGAGVAKKPSQPYGIGARRRPRQTVADAEARWGVFGVGGVDKGEGLRCKVPARRKNKCMFPNLQVQNTKPSPKIPTHTVSEASTGVGRQPGTTGWMWWMGWPAKTSKKKQRPVQQSCWCCRTSWLASWHRDESSWQHENRYGLVRRDGCPNGRHWGNHCTNTLSCSHQN